jgi:hypothetical protein
LRGCSRCTTAIVSLTIVATLSYGCVKVPAVDPEKESIRLGDLVKRVKCDMYYAVSTVEQTPSGPVLVPLSTKKGYEWLSNWVIQANLNLVVNNQSGLTPGATFITPLKSVILPGKGTFSQSYSTGIGAGVNTTAQRTDTFAFSLSLAEIETELSSKETKLTRYDDCLLKDGTNLDSDLQLKEWFWSSMAPVQRNYLHAGLHKAPKSAATSTPAQGGAKALASSSTYSEFIKMNVAPPGPPPDPVVTALQADMQIVKDTIDKVVSTYNEEILSGTTPTPGAVSENELKAVYEQEWKAIKAIDDATRIVNDPANKNNKNIDSYIASLSVKVGDPPHALDRTTFYQYLQSVEDSLLWDRRLYVLSRSKVSSPEEIKGLMDTIDTNIRDLGNFGEIAHGVVVQLRTVRAKLAAALASFDPPIDSISHQVQFIVAWTGNVSPSWSLVQFKGPSPSSGPFVSGSTSDTNTLSVVIGPPGSDTASQLSALQIGNSVQNALNSVTVKTVTPP